MAEPVFIFRCPSCKQYARVREDATTHNHRAVIVLAGKQLENVKRCPSCRCFLPKVAKRCPSCRKFLYPNLNPHKMRENQERNREMVRLLDAGENLRQVGEQFGISRERVRQLYKVVTGKAYTQVVKARTKKAKRRKRLAKLEHSQKIKFVCKSCDKAVTYGESPQGELFCPACSRSYRTGNARDPRVTLICDNPDCRKKYHPWPNWRSGKNKNRKYHFCSPPCTGKTIGKLYLEGTFDKKA